MAPAARLIDAVVGQLVLSRDAGLVAELLAIPARAAVRPNAASGLASRTPSTPRVEGEVDADALRAHLASLPTVVTTLVGAAKLSDHLRLVCVRALVAAPAVHPPALTEAVRILTLILGQRFGGKTIEVRVPPAAAVQLGAFGQGPTHTRGTPPNVIETDPATFFALATGRLGYADAHDRVVASVSHAADLPRMLPVVDW
ncbi:MAG TPA: sterol carrier family protein [Propionibacteriaceae bacterium]|nr:sterol carrier family protein [Propionibacteriaceae bacterium]